MQLQYQQAKEAIHIRRFYHEQMNERKDRISIKQNAQTYKIRCEQNFSRVLSGPSIRK